MRASGKTMGVFCTVQMYFPWKHTVAGSFIQEVKAMTECYLQ